MQVKDTIDISGVVEIPGPHTGYVPAIIYDRASDVGGYVYADKAHMEKARQQAHANNMYIVGYYWEDEKGDNPNRPKYGEVLAAIQSGLAKVIIVSDMARFSRGGWERIQRLEMIESAGGRIWRTDKGCYDEPGQDRYNEAFVDKDFLHKQAIKAHDNLPYAAAAGKVMGEMPTGLKRELRLNADKTQVETVVVKHPDYAPLVERVGIDYANGKSVKDIVTDLNAGSLPNPHAADGVWANSTIYSILHCDAHMGVKTWGKKRRGRFMPWDGAVQECKLECGPMWDDATYQLIQQRLLSNSVGRKTNRQGFQVQLLDGFLHCKVCGAKTYPASRTKNGRTTWKYICSNVHRGKTHCEPASISTILADKAVVSELRRLQGQPWSDAAFDAQMRTDPNEPLRIRLRSEIAACQHDTEKWATKVALLQDIGPHVMEQLKAQGRQLELRMQHLKDQLASVPMRVYDPVKARELYDVLVSNDLSAFIERSVEQGNTQALRDLMALLVKEVYITDRGSSSNSGKHSSWARAEVKWSDNADVLFACGLLTKTDTEDPDPRQVARDKARERVRRYRGRQKSNVQNSGE